MNIGEGFVSGKPCRVIELRNATLLASLVISILHCMGESELALSNSRKWSEEKAAYNEG